MMRLQCSEKSNNEKLVNEKIRGANPEIPPVLGDCFCSLGVLFLSFYRITNLKISSMSLGNCENTLRPKV